MNFYTLFENHLKFILPELFLSISVLVLVTYGLFLHREQAYRKINWLSIYALVIVFILLIVNSVYGVSSSESITIFHKMLVVDSLTTFVKCIVVAGSIFSLLLSISEKLKHFEYSILVLIATLALLLLVSSYDLISMYMAIELQALSLYVLAAFKRNSEFSTEAGLKYFILGALSSGLLLFGISIIYGFTGMTNFGDLASFFLFHQQKGLILGLVFVGSGLLFKLGAVPFHMWVPDVYEGSPTAVTAFFAITPKIAILVIFIRFYIYAFYGLTDLWTLVIILSSIGSMIVGALGALYQTKIKRLLAYSAIGHVGYILIGLSTGTVEGIQSILIYSVVYMVAVTGIFAVVLSLPKFKYITQLAGLGQSNKSLAAILAIMFFSLAGIPPLAGFYGKLYIFMSAVHSSSYLLAIVGVLTSAISALYYIRIIKIIYFDKVDEKLYWSVGMEKAILLASTTLFTLFFALYPSILVLLTHKIALLIIL